VPDLFSNADLSRRSARDIQRAKTDRRVAWWLVWLYPPSFRQDVGLGLVDTLEDGMRARRAAGASPLRSRLPALADTIRNAPIEWIGAIDQVRPFGGAQGRPEALEGRLKPDTTYPFWR
jgi:hypothetical protein